MSRHAPLMLFTLILSFAALADEEAAPEPQDETARASAQRDAAAQEAEALRARNATEAQSQHVLMDTYRRTLGPDAIGKSNAEIMQLMQLRQTRHRGMLPDTEARRRATVSAPLGSEAAAVTPAPAKRENDREPMSDPETDALVRALEKKYGK